MAVRNIQRKAWQRAIDAEDPTVTNLSRGFSPGGAAARLGISRQAVHYAIQRGTLDALAVHDGEKLLHYTISADSLEAYRAKLQQRAFDLLQRSTRQVR